MDPQVQENYEHVAIIAVKKQLGEEYRDDGPPLSVEFDLIHRSFYAPIGCDTGDLHRRLNMVKRYERYNVLEGDNFHFPKLNSSAESLCSGFSRKSTMPGRIGIRYKEMPISYPHNNIDPCYNVSGVNTVVTAGTHLARSGYLPSSRGQDEAHEKKDGQERKGPGRKKNP